MLQVHPGGEVDIEQLVHALGRALDQNFMSGSNLLGLEPSKIFAIERDLSKSLRVIRAIRNTYTPINKLPPEILSRILEHRDSEQDLVAATHVCQYWRSTLTSSPSLWACVKAGSSRDVDCMLTYLERSKAATIDIRITLDASDVIKHFTPHISRTRSLFVRGTLNVSAVSSLLLCSPAPFLERLEMRAREGPLRDIDNFLGLQAPSLRSLTLEGVFPVLEFPPSLPGLAELDLHLDEDAGVFCMSSLFRLFFGCPQLQKIRVDISCEILHDLPLDQVTSLESLVELVYHCNTAGKILPRLRLPRLEQLLVSCSLQEGQMNKLSNLLPHGGHVLLAEATSLSYFSDQYSHTIELSGKGTNVISLGGFDFSGGGVVTIDWFSDETCIPLGRIENLELEGCYVPTYFPIDLFNALATLRVTPWDEEFVERYLELLHPHPEAGVPCPSLRKINCTFRSSPRSHTRPLIHLARERGRVGHQLELVCISTREKLDQGLEDELREHVGELRVEMSRGQA